jgi:hypothetical protein
VTHRRHAAALGAAGFVAVLAAGGCGPAASHPSTTPVARVTTPTAPSSATTMGQPPLVDNCGGGAFKPTTIYVICGQAKLTATKIQWSSWTAEQARGTATMSVIVCRPSCSQGHEELLPAELTLTDPRPTSRGPEFTRAIIAWSATSPDGNPVDTYPLKIS